MDHGGQRHVHIGLHRIPQPHGLVGRQVDQQTIRQGRRRFVLGRVHTRRRCAVHTVVRRLVRKVLAGHHALTLLGLAALAEILWDSRPFDWINDANLVATRSPSRWHAAAGKRAPHLRCVGTSSPKPAPNLPITDIPNQNPGGPIERWRSSAVPVVRRGGAPGVSPSLQKWNARRPRRPPTGPAGRSARQRRKADSAAVRGSTPPTSDRSGEVTARRRQLHDAPAGGTGRVAHRRDHLLM